MKRTKDILIALAVVLAFALGTVACSGGMAGSGNYGGPSASSGNSNEPAMPTDTSSGPAHRTVSGKIVKIDGPYYDVMEYTGSRVRLHVNSKTVMIGGNKKVGDKVRAEITRGHHANSMQ